MDLVVSLPQVNLGEDGAPVRIGGEIQHIGRQVDIQLCYQIEPAEISAGTLAAICCSHHVK
jgi:hypothetical protein